MEKSKHETACVSVVLILSEASTPPPGASLPRGRRSDGRIQGSIDLCTYGWEESLLRRTNDGKSSGISSKRRGCGNYAIVKRDFSFSYRM